MDRILLIIRHPENQRLLSACLAQDYEVVSFAPNKDSIAGQAAPPTADLGLVDGDSLGQMMSALTAMRAESAPLWLPVLLVIPKSKIPHKTHQCWQSIDEVIAVPIEKAELLTRIGVLLRVRQLSQQLLDANRTLQMQNQQLQELNQLKSQFVSMVSHEFQNPLGAISGFLQLLLRQGDKLSASKRQRYLEKAQATLSHLKTLVNDVLVIGRVGRLKFEPVVINLVELCQTLLEEIRFNAQAQGRIEFTVAAGSETTLAAVAVDPNLLRQIITNLVTNALKYSPEGRPISFSLSHKESQILLSIQDQGIGIPESDLPSLFEPFYRASNVGTQAGTGLGLAITQQCVELHDGDITLESNIGIGTLVRVSLPLKNDSVIVRKTDI